ncbi:hypothetical protein BGZ99_004454 [Dissophora globulifera]|uniref:Golgi apparatus membrane protein TVP38 n=1 Tax=Dissophora globulifera TaxID=979702 RepID=A0A9P6RXS2_9FUNG|nr:hypothetical protein BGZ99_004454 [Dissophora globulifera]
MSSPTFGGETLSSSSPNSPHFHQHQRQAPTSSSLSSHQNENNNNSKGSIDSAGSSGLWSIPGRIVQYGVSIALGIQASLPASVRPWFWVGLSLVFFAISLGIFAGFHTKFFELLEAMASFIKSLGRAGPPIIMLGLFLTAFPPVVGYSSLVTMSGYVYGFGFGMFIAYTSALLGSVACFYLCRRWFKVQVRALMAKKQSMRSVVKAVEKRGFKLMLLIRLAPYPFNVTNALLSATHVPLSTFTIATAISLTKLALHVYVGSTLSSLAVLPPPPIVDDDGNTTVPLPPAADPNSHARSIKIVVMVFSMILGIVVGAYVWIEAKREIEASEGIRIERRRKRRESMRQNRRSLNRPTSLGPNGVAIVTAGRGSGRAPDNGNQLLARSGFGGAGGQDDMATSQDRVPVVDLSTLSASGGAAAMAIGTKSRSDFVGSATTIENTYFDYEDVQEDETLVDHSYHRNHQHQNHSSGAISNGMLEYVSETEDSEFMDDDEDDDEDMSDMERGTDADNDTDSLLQHGTEMDTRYPLRSPTHRPDSRRTSEHETMGWFAENGADISDRRW